MFTAPAMPVRVFLADDSNIMRDAIRKLLDGEPSIKIVGEADTFTGAIQMLPESKADVLLLDLHMPQKRELQAPLIQSQLSCVRHTIAISFANDEEARKLAASYGAATLLDKMSLYSDLVPAVMQLVAAPSAAKSNSTSAFNLDVKPAQAGGSSQLSE
jgi:DNA-binding NarL/FixJ family response regulator